MRKWISLIAVLLFATAAAADPTVLVTAVEGKHGLDKGTGVPAALEAFMRLSKGDRVVLPAKGKLTLIYLATARQENWQGAGALLVGDGQSEAVAGKPRGEVRQLPAAIVRQINRTPTTAADGRVGMVRLREVRLDDVAFKLDKDYRKLKSDLPEGDLTPEVFLLAGLFEQGEYARIEQELQRIATEFPEQPAVEALKNNYLAAIAEVRKAKK